MNNAWAVCKREFSSYFVTPIGYVVLATFAVISGLGFTANFLLYAQMSQEPAMYQFTAVPDLEEEFLSPFLVYCGMIVMFIGPLITMRLLAEERNQGTMELLLTHPLRDIEIVAGKYGAALGVMLSLVPIVAVYMFIVNYYAQVEPAVLIFGLFTVLLMGAAFLSLGLFVSALCSNQITAATVSFGLFLAFYILGTMAEDLPDELAMLSQWPEAIREPSQQAYGVLVAIVQELPLDAHALEMAQGIVQPQDVAYYVLFAAFFFFLTLRAVDGWRGKA